MPYIDRISYTYVYVMYMKRISYVSSGGGGGAMGSMNGRCMYIHIYTYIHMYTYTFYIHSVYTLYTCIPLSTEYAIIYVNIRHIYSVYQYTLIYLDIHVVYIRDNKCTRI